MYVVEAANDRAKPARPQECIVARSCLTALVLLGVLTTSAGAQVAVPSTVAIGQRPTRKLTLPQALELAMQHNRNLQVARLGIADAQQKKNIVRSSYYPNIKNESTAVHLTELEGVVIPAGAFASGAATGLVPSNTVRVGQGAQDAFTSGTGLAQPITQLLRVHAGVRAATADVNIAGYEAAGAENSIALLVHKLYFAILTTQIKLNAAEESVKAGTVAEQESMESVAEGHSLDLTKLEAHAALLEEKQASLTAQLAIDDLTTQFDDVLGLPLGIGLELDADMLGESVVLPSEEEAMTAVKAHNPKVLSARQMVEKAKAGVTAAKDAYIPDITGLARYSYQSGVPLLVHNFGSFGGVVTYELFDGGARRARLREATIELHIAELRLTQTESDISVQVSAAYDEIRKLQQLIAVVSESLTVRTEALRVTQQRQEQNAALASETAKAGAGEAAARASVLEATLDLLLVQNQVRELLGRR
jgi:outer membrane protein TolC